MAVATDFTVLGLGVDSRQVVSADQALARFAASGARAEGALQRMEARSASLGRALGPVAAALSTAKVIEYADAYSQVNARLALVTNGQGAFNRVQAELLQLANDTRVSVVETVDLYARLARSTKTLAASDSDRLQVTKAINQALIVSGASGASAQAALLQLSQGFASGTLRGEELNSVMEQTPRLAEAIADGLGVTIGQLRAMGKAGELTTGAVFGALQSQADRIDREFGRIPVTIGQSLQVAQNRLQTFIGQQSQVSGAGAAVSKVINTLSGNIEVLTAAALGFGAAKLAGTILSAAAAASRGVASIQAQVAATRAQQVAQAGAAAATTAQTAATLNQARAASASVAATLAHLQATQAAIVAARADAVAKLQAAQAATAQAAAQLAAARAAGAGIAATAAQALATDALAAAQRRQAAVVTTLATLGRQQASVSASIAAANTAQAAAAASAATAAARNAAAQTAATAATAAGGVAAGIAGRALGLLGGPIGAITTLLGLGATAWALWGNSAAEATDKAADGAKRALLARVQSDVDQLSNINAELARLQKGGASTPRDQTFIRELEAQRATLVAAIDSGRAELEAQRRERERNDRIARNEVARRVDPVAVRNRQIAAREEFLKENATDAEKFAAAVKEAKKEMGDLFTPEMEARLRARFLKGKDNTKDVLGFDLAAIRRDLQGLTTSYSVAEGILEATRQAGLADERTYYESKRAFIALNADAEIRALQAENSRLAAAKGNAKELLDNQRSIADNTAKIAQIRAKAAADAVVLGIQEKAAFDATTAAIRNAENALISYTDSLKRAQQREVEGLGLGNAERGRRDGRAQIEDKFEEQRRELNRSRRDSELSGTFGAEQQRRYDAELALINRFQQEALDSFDRYYAERRRKEQDFNVGALESMRNYIDSVRQTAKQIEGVFDNAFQNLEDAFTKFFTTGKLDFKEFATQIRDDITRILVRQNITGPIAEILQGGFQGGTGLGGAIQRGLGTLVGGGGSNLTQPIGGGLVDDRSLGQRIFSLFGFNVSPFGAGGVRPGAGGAIGAAGATAQQAAQTAALTASTTALGGQTTALGAATAALGAGTTATGAQTTAIGAATVAEQATTTALGALVVAADAATAALGKLATQEAGGDALGAIGSLVGSGPGQFAAFDPAGIPIGGAQPSAARDALRAMEAGRAAASATEAVAEGGVEAAVATEVVATEMDSATAAIVGMEAAATSASNSLGGFPSLLSGIFSLLSSGGGAGASGLLGGLFGATGGAGAGGLFGALTSLFGFAEGGYTGPGGKYTPRGFVHAGEVVWSQADIARAGGVSVVEGMRRGVLPAQYGVPGTTTGVQPRIIDLTRLKIEPPTPPSDEPLTKHGEIVWSEADVRRVGGLEVAEGLRKGALGLAPAPVSVPPVAQPGRAGRQAQIPAAGVGRRPEAGPLPVPTPFDGAWSNPVGSAGALARGPAIFPAASVHSSAVRAVAAAASRANVSADAILHGALAPTKVHDLPPGEVAPGIPAVLLAALVAATAPGAPGGPSIVASMAAGRASGGNVLANTLQPVNERGPELLSVDGRDYLMMGARGGEVQPLREGKGGKQTIVINNMFAPGTTQRTVEQAGAQMGRQIFHSTSRGTTG